MRVNDAPFPVQAAVERALAKQTQEATREVEAILDAALRVAQRCAPDAPRVADIVAEAGISNQAFYRYFAGKDDLMHAVFERGIQRLGSYLAHQMDKEKDPREQIAAWIRGVLTQVMDQTAAHQGAAVVSQLNRGSRGADPFAMLSRMLVDPIRHAGSHEPELDAQVIQEAVTGTLRRHLDALTSPDPVEAGHLAAFCLRGLST